MYDKFLNSFENVMGKAGYVKINLPAGLPCASKVALWAREHGSMAYFYIIHDIDSMNWSNFPAAKGYMNQALETIATRISARHRVAFHLFVGAGDYNVTDYINSTVEFALVEQYDMFIGIDSGGINHSYIAPMHMDKVKDRLEAVLSDMKGLSPATPRVAAFPDMTPPPAPRPAQPPPPVSIPRDHRKNRGKIHYGLPITKLRWPIFTVIIIAMNVMLFLFSGMEQGSGIMQAFAAHSFWIMTMGEWHRLVTSMFLHGDFFHIFANTLFLVLAGIRAEQHFGHLKFLLIYFIGGIAGSFAMITFTPLTWGVGASGGIFALLGAMMAYMLITKRPIATFTAQALGMMIGINILIGIAVPGISNSAHMGGLIMGFALGALFTKIASRKK